MAAREPVSAQATLCFDFFLLKQQYHVSTCTAAQITADSVEAALNSQTTSKVFRATNACMLRARTFFILA